MSLALLREMFAEMVVKKDASKIPVYEETLIEDGSRVGGRVWIPRRGRARRRPGSR